MIFSRPNWSYLPCVLLSLIAAAVFYAHYGISFGMIVLHGVAVLLGMFVLDAISFIYRLTSFWTSSIVQVRNSNPSFKIMVRPLSAFGGKLRLFLLTIFPALFITGVPSSLLTRALAPFWLAACGIAAGILWAYVGVIWTVGSRRYGKFVT
jgi:ABC-2 type transport system permease protein